MRLCIPAAEAQGLQSRLQPHFPDAVAYQIFDTESKTHVEILLGDNAPADQEHGPIHAVICGSINRRGLLSFHHHGIQVMGTHAQTVAEAIAQFERGELQAAPPVVGCGGHSHQHGQGEAHECCGGGVHGDDHECCGGDRHGEDHECCGGGGCHGGEHGHEHGHHHAREGGCCCKD